MPEMPGLGEWLGQITTERGTATIGYNIGTAHRFTNEEGNTWEEYPQTGTVTQVRSLSVAGTQNVWYQTHDSLGRDTGRTYSDGSSTARGYDTNGNVTFDTDRQGNTSTYQYDANNNLTQAADPQGNTTSYTYTADGDVATVTDPYGKVTTYTYDANRNLLSVTDPLNRTTTFTYDAHGQRTGVTSPGGLATSYQYDTSGNLVSETDPAGKTTAHTYDAHGNRLTTTAPDGKTTTFSYDSADRVTQVLHPDARTRQYTYGCCGVLTATDENAKTTTYEYTALGQVRTITDPANRTTTFAYTPGGQIHRVVDANGSERRYQYDTQARLTGITQAYPSAAFPAEPALLESYAYTPGARPSAKTDANGQTIAFSYDSSGRLARKRFPDATVAGFDYDAVGRRTAMFDTTSALVTAEAETGPGVTTGTEPWSTVTAAGASGGAYRQCTAQTSNAWISYTFTGTWVDLRYTKTAGKGSWGKVYLDGREIGDINFWAGEGATEDQHGILFHKDGLAYGTHTLAIAYSGDNMTFDPEFGMGELVPPAMNVDSFQTETDATAQAALVEAETGPGVTTGAAPWSAVAAEGASGGAYYQCQTAGADATISFAFTGTWVDLTYSQTVNKGSQANVFLDGQDVGDLNFWAGGEAIMNGLPDQHGLVFRKQGLAYGPHTLTVTYSGDNWFMDPEPLPAALNVDAFRAEAAGGRSNQTLFAYDDAGQLTRVTEPGGKHVAYTYNANGQRATMTDYDGGVTTYQYGAAGLLASLANPWNETTTWLYDPLSRPARQTLANGTYAEYTYDPNRGWLTQVANKKADGTVLSSFTYVYDNAGNRTRMAYADGKYIDYGYDNAYQLTGEVKRNPDASVVYDQAWTYDPAGNRLTQVKDGVPTNYTYDSNNRMLSAGAKTFSYDNNGNTISETDGGVATTYSYDYENHLTATSAGESFAYRQDGLRVRKVSGGVETRFLHDWGRVWGETDGQGVTRAVCLQGVSQRRDGVSSFYGGDALGSTAHLTDSAGTVTDSYSYDAFGNVTQQAGATVNALKFVGSLGYHADGDTGLMLLGHRYYSPETGRFITVDPIKDGLNWYAYCGNNPANSVDPRGLADIDNDGYDDGIECPVGSPGGPIGFGPGYGYGRNPGRGGGGGGGGRIPGPYPPWAQGRCSRIACNLQRKHGGDVWRLEPNPDIRPKPPLLPKPVGGWPDGYEWGHHDVVVVDGMVIDPMQRFFYPGISVSDWLQYMNHEPPWTIWHPMPIVGLPFELK